MRLTQYFIAFMPVLFMAGALGMGLGISRDAHIAATILADDTPVPPCVGADDISYNFSNPCNSIWFSVV